MTKKRKRLFMFRAGKEVGMVRAYNVLEALNIVYIYFPGPAEIRPVPTKFSLFVPVFK